jgi:hypothetical protein
MVIKVKEDYLDLKGKEVMSIVLKFWKQIAVLVLVVGSFIGGYMIKTCDDQPSIVKNDTVETNIDKKIDKVKEKTTTITNKAGKQVVIVEKSTDKTTESKTEHSTESTSIKPPQKNRYSLGFSAVIDPTQPFKSPDYSLQAGKRLGDTNFWGTAGYQLGNKNVSLGVRWDF